MDTETKIHVFETAGLGKAPFRCVGVETRRGPINLGNGMTVGAPGQPMGCCKYCGTGIADCYLIKSSDGKLFEVGCDCVAKTGDAGLKKVVNQHLKKARNEATDKRIAAAQQAWSEKPELRELAEKLNTDPEGMKSLAPGYIDFCYKNAGRAGKLRVSRQVEKLLKEAACLISE